MHMTSDFSFEPAVSTKFSFLRQLKEAISKNLQEAQELEGELMARLPEAVQTTNGISQLAVLRSKIKIRYEHVVLHDPRFSAEKNIEQLLWKVSVSTALASKQSF